MKPKPNQSVEISSNDEIVKAIQSIRGKFLMFSGNFGPSGLVGRIVTPKNNSSIETMKPKPNQTDSFQCQACFHEFVNNYQRITRRCKRYTKHPSHLCHDHRQGKNGGQP